MKSSTIYHYCSLDSFNKIIKNQSIRFSDITKSNDSNEINFLWNKYYEYIENNSGREKSAFLKYEIKNQLEHTIFLTACFTSNNDSLHMWNCYADGGIAIGFDYNKMKKLPKRVCLPCDDKTIRNEASFGIIKKVNYYNLKSIESFVKKICSNIEFTTDKFYDIFINAPFSKSSFFNVEDEIRIVFPFIIDLNSKPYFDYVDSNCCFLKTIDLNINLDNNSAIYLDVPFDKECIKEIVIGPNCIMNRNDIFKLLFVLGYEVDVINIKKTECTYR